MRETNVIHTGDSMDILDDLPENSVHALVTDPPYGLAFMGRSWDDFEPKEYQDFCERWASKALRVLKPGGHLLAFSGNRTHHRLFSGVEDAGYEIRDTITWHYGSGFPKALDVSKSIDKQADAEREVTGPSTLPDGTPHEYNIGYGEGEGFDSRASDRKETAPATDAAEKWDGFKTALKPATEYLVVARKPFDGTVAENIQKHGTGALNIERCRIGTDTVEQGRGGRDVRDTQTYGKYEGQDERQYTEGRYPANVIFDETQAEALDREVGPRPSDGIDFSETTDTQSRDKYGEFDGERTESYVYDDDHDGPSRYFYTSKATRAERTLDGKIDNAHPTVKPTDLMEWLVTLVTAENQIVLDPFIGSGTTGMACKNKNRQFIGIEQNEEYADIARVRCGLTPDDPSVVRKNDNQNGLGDYV